MLIDWKGAGPLSVHDPRKSSNYKLATVIVCLPGINKLEDAVWHGDEKHPGLKDNPAFKTYIEEGLIVVQRERDGDQSKAEKSREAVELHGLNLPESLKVITGTLNLELLNSWLETDSRPKIQSAIRKQIKSIMSAEEKNSEE